MSDRQKPRKSRENSVISLTPKQKEVLDYIHSYMAEKAYAPSQQEIAKNFGFKSLGTVQNYLVRLERQGLLRKTWNSKRGMQVIHNPTPEKVQKPVESALDAMAHSLGAVPLPLLGLVAAGKPIEAMLHDETIDVPASMIKGGDHFVLRVTGQSMIEDGILSGDYVVIKKQKNAENGQTVVALVGNEATIKRYYRRGGKVELHPANPAYNPLILESLVESTDFRIEGVLVGLIRRMS